MIDVHSIPVPIARRRRGHERIGHMEPMLVPSTPGRVEVQDDGLAFWFDNHHEGSVVPWAQITQVAVEAEQFVLDDAETRWPVTRRVVVEMAFGEFVEFVHPMVGLEDAVGILHRHLDVTVDDPVQVLRTLGPGSGPVVVARGADR